MRLYAEYKKAIVDIQKEDKIIKAYFTTFNISPEFVERYIIPPLYGKELPTTELHYEEINKAIEDSSIDLQFYHDANMLQLDESKRTIAKFYPVLLKIGVFHPKVIYLEGEKKSYLFVGSGNLTLNGWGRNKEAFRIVKFKNKSNLFSEVWNFFDDVGRVAKRESSTPRKEPTNEQNLNFIYSFNNKSTFLEHLNLGQNLQVWSPYFSDLDELVRGSEFSKVKTIKIIPDIKDGKKIRLSKQPTDSKLSFYEDSDASKVQNRFNHAKVWLSDTKIAIGSYNMTKQAISGINFEAALIEDISANSDLFKVGDAFKIDITEENDIELNDELNEKSRYTSLYKLSANWKTRKLKICNLLDDSQDEKLRVRLPSSVEVLYEDVKNLDVNETVAIFSALVRNKVFTVSNEKGIIFRGLIEEESKGFRDELKAEDLNDIFYFFDEDKKADEMLKDKLERRVLDKALSDLDTSKILSHKEAFQGNYFTMFKGFKKLYARLEKVQLEKIQSKKEKELHKFCFSSAVSLTTIIHILEQEKKDKEQNLFLYLCIEEINKIISVANKRIKNYDDLSKLKKIENIGLSLTPEDELFLKACNV